MAHGPSGSKKALDTLAALRSRITSGEWPVDTRIPREPELMEMFDVGRSTVREAVRSLASLGMLEPIKGIGTFVRSRTPVTSLLSGYIAEFSLAEILIYRRALEVEAVQQAAVRRTEEQLAELRRALEQVPPPPSAAGLKGMRVPGAFHRLLIDASGSDLLIGTYAGVLAALRTASGTGVLVHGIDDETRYGDHAAILAAIEERNPAAAAHAMSAHADRDLVIVGGAEPTQAADAPPGDRADARSGSPAGAP